MSLNSFFDSLDTDAQFNAWRKGTIQKLEFLLKVFPKERDSKTHLKYLYVESTIDYINNLHQLHTDYAAEYSDKIEDKRLHLKEALKICNSYYKEFGKQ